MVTGATSVDLDSYAQRMYDSRALWAVAAGLLGALIGLALAVGRAELAIVTVLVPIGVALVLWPRWLPPALIVTVFAETLTFGGLAISRVVGPFALGVVLLHLGSQRENLPLRDRRLPWAIALLVLWALASSLWTANFDPTLAVGGTAFALSSLGLTLTYFVAILFFVRTEADVSRTLYTIWAVSVVMGLVAIAEYFTGQGRAVSGSGDANFFATLQVIAIPLGAVLAGQVRSNRSRTIILLGTGLVVGSVFTSVSRGGILALTALLLLLAIQPARAFFRTKVRKRAFVTIATLGAILLLILSWGALSDRTGSFFSTDEGGSGRSNLWLAAVTGFEEHPVRGIGFGAFLSESNYLMLRSPGVEFSAYKLRPGGQAAHSLYLEALVEMGIIGLTLLLAVLVACMLTLRRAMRLAEARDAQFISAAARGTLLALVGFMIASLFLSTATDRTLWMLFALSLSLSRLAAHLPQVRSKPT